MRSKKGKKHISAKEQTMTKAANKSGEKRNQRHDTRRGKERGGVYISNPPAGFFMGPILPTPGRKTKKGKNSGGEKSFFRAGARRSRSERRKKGGKNR